MAKIKELDLKADYILDGELFTYNGSEYKINVDENSSGEINYFQISDANGEFVGEMDWGGGVPGDVILDVLQENA